MVTSPAMESAGSAVGAISDWMSSQSSRNFGRSSSRKGSSREYSRSISDCMSSQNSRESRSSSSSKETAENPARASQIVGAAKVAARTVINIVANPILKT